MATTSKSEKIFIGIGEEMIELTGTDKKEFEADRTQMHENYLLLETEYKAKQEARDSAIKKLGEIAGLTKEELDAIL